MLNRPGNGNAGRFSVDSTTSSASTDLQAKAEQKREFVQEMIRNLERAVRNSNKQEDRRYLRNFIEPDNQCFRTLINLMTSQKYAGFVSLRCVVLRAIQMLLKIAQSLHNMEGSKKQMPATADENNGMKVLQQLVGEQMASEAFRELSLIVTGTDQALAACDAMLVLAELGPQAFELRFVHTLLDLFALLPDRAPDLVEVSLRVHAWGGPVRKELLQAAVTHEGGRYMGEVLLQVVNRRQQDKIRQLRAVKIFTGCFCLPNGSHFLYTNDKRVLVEILLRELPRYAGNAAEFVCLAECYRALVSHCDVARSHHGAEAIQLFEDHGEDDRFPREVTEKCTEVLAILKSSPLD
jgi:hypothetical protein